MVILKDGRRYVGCRTLEHAFYFKADSTACCVFSKVVHSDDRLSVIPQEVNGFILHPDIQ
jgi:hypothetical protein